MDVYDEEIGKNYWMWKRVIVIELLYDKTKEYGLYLNVLVDSYALGTIFFINIGVRISLYVPQLILRVLKLTTI